MKTTIFSALLASLVFTAAIAQDVTTVNATSSEISDNLDLRAVASIFGDASDLEDFERKLNDPKLQISNLDLNNDNQVDYLRVIETVEQNTHLIVLQSVLARDVYQDVATIEVERDANNNVQVQVVGDVYMYGPNYIYEPVYVHTPVIFTSFWVGYYRPYCSSWYWGYYPSYYYAWNPYPVFRYRRNVYHHINIHHHYNYVNVRRSERAVAMYQGRRFNGYERQYPNRSFRQRHANVANRYELDQRRNTKDLHVKNGLVAGNTRNAVKSNGNIRTETVAVRNNNQTRSNGNVRSENNTIRTRDNQGVRIQSTPRENNPIQTRNQNVGSTRDNGIRTRDTRAAGEQSPANQSIGVRAPGENQAIRSQSISQKENRNTRAESAPRQNRVEQRDQPNRMETARNRMGSASRLEARPNRAQPNATPRMESRGNAERNQNMASNRQSQSRNSNAGSRGETARESRR